LKGRDEGTVGVVASLEGGEAEDHGEI
jgi:hypothetical protein